MNTWKVIGRNILSNWAGFVVHVVVAFALTPVVVNTLGSSTYGAWALITSLTGYYGLLDIGLRAGLTQYLARYYANRDMARLNQTASTGFVALAALAGVAAMATVIVGLNLEHWFEIASSELSEVRTAVFILGGSTAVQFVFFPFSAVFTAVQRFDLSNAIGIATRVAYALAAYAVLRGGYGLTGLSIVVALTGLIDYSIRWYVAYRILPGLSVRIGLARLGSIWEQVTFGAWNVVIEGSVRLIAYTDALVIGFFLSAAAITPFALATSLVEYFAAVFRPIGYVFFPAITEQDAKGDRRAVVDLFINGSRLLAVLVLPASLIAYTFAGPFFRLWIGEPAEAGLYPSAASLFSVLLIATLASACQRVTYQVYLATRRMRLIASLFLLEAFFNLVLSVSLIRSFGLMGVAIGTLIPAVLIEWVILPTVLCRILGVPARLYFWKVYFRPIVTTAMLVPAIQLISSWYPLTDWFHLLVAGIVSTFVTGVAIILIGLDRDVRSRMVWRPTARAGRQVWALLART